jgi:hypothetical protein
MLQAIQELPAAQIQRLQLAADRALYQDSSAHAVSASPTKS